MSTMKYSQIVCMSVDPCLGDHCPGPHIERPIMEAIPKEELVRLRDELAAVKAERDELRAVHEAELGVCEFHCEVLATVKTEREDLLNLLRRLMIWIREGHMACTEARAVLEKAGKT